jgi:muramoyltetrapeptide carboxypeptidase
LFFEILQGQRTAMRAPHNALNIHGETTSTLTGGNLSVLYSLLGSASDIDTTGKILFLEDLDEYRYHIDRMMQALKRAGKLDKLAGLVVGGMNDMKDNTVPFGKDAGTIIREYAGPFGYPVCFGFPAGHIEHNLPLIMGASVTLSVGEEVTLKYTL